MNPIVWTCDEKGRLNESNSFGRMKTNWKDTDHFNKSDHFKK